MCVSLTIITPSKCITTRHARNRALRAIPAPRQALRPEPALLALYRMPHTSIQNRADTIPAGRRIPNRFQIRCPARSSRPDSARFETLRAGIAVVRRGGATPPPCYSQITVFQLRRRRVGAAEPIT